MQFDNFLKIYTFGHHHERQWHNTKIYQRARVEMESHQKSSKKYR